jgi:hypothetical protein
VKTPAEFPEFDGLIDGRRMYDYRPERFFHDAVEVRAGVMLPQTPLKPRLFAMDQHGKPNLNSPLSVYVGEYAVKPESAKKIGRQPLANLVDKKMKWPPLSELMDSIRDPQTRWKKYLEYRKDFEDLIRLADSRDTGARMNGYLSFEDRWYRDNAKCVRFDTKHGRWVVMPSFRDAMRERGHTPRMNRWLTDGRVAYLMDWLPIPAQVDPLHRDVPRDSLLLWVKYSRPYMEFRAGAPSDILHRFGPQPGQQEAKMPYEYKRNVVSVVVQTVVPKPAAAVPQQSATASSSRGNAQRRRRTRSRSHASQSPSRPRVGAGSAGVLLGNPAARSYQEVFPTQVRVPWADATDANPPSLARVWQPTLEGAAGVAPRGSVARAPPKAATPAASPPRPSTGANAAGASSSRPASAGSQRTRTPTGSATGSRPGSRDRVPGGVDGRFQGVRQQTQDGDTPRSQRSYLSGTYAASEASYQSGPSRGSGGYYGRGRASNTQGPAPSQSRGRGSGGGSGGRNPGGRR